jgi:zinc protease
MTTPVGNRGVTKRPPRPEPGAPRAYHFPRFERRRLSNGLELVIAPVDKLPLVTVLVLFEAGAMCDPAGREGLAQLTCNLLLEGTQDLDGSALSERFERLGASVDAHADWDTAAISLTALTENLSSAFDLLAEVIREPAFRQREVERLQAERTAELLQLRAEPRGLADEFFSRFLYEAGARYATPEGGTEDSVKRLTRADVESFFQQQYRPANATVIVVGDVSAVAAERLVSRHLGDWTGDAAEPPTSSEKPARSTRAVHLIAKADAPQSELRLGHVGLPRHHPDYFPVMVMNAILGGLFNSRINLNLREVHGYTYGAFSTFDWRRQAGPFVVHTAVRSDATDASAREVLVEIDRIRSQPVGAEELSLATSYLDGVFPIRYETTSAIAAALATLVVHELPDDYFDEYRSNVRGVTIGDVQDVAARHLHPDALQMVVVGDPAAVRAPLDAMQFGPVMIYDPQGRPV